MNYVLPKGLIVSCQALKDEPMYGGDSIVKMAVAAVLGGAVGIRANTVRDVNAISKRLKGTVPVIGLIKKQYPDSPVYITPTLKEVKALVSSKCDVIALDATDRIRPEGATLEELVGYVRAHSRKALMADVSTLAEAKRAEELGFEYISTTLRSYTEETKGVSIPDIAFCKELQENITTARLVAEGGIRTCEELTSICGMGYGHVVIGGAITRPQNITRGFVEAFSAVAE